MIFRYFSFLIIFTLIPLLSRIEDGSCLWLRFPDIKQKEMSIILSYKSPTINITMEELTSYWKGKTVKFHLNKTPGYQKSGYGIRFNNNKITVLLMSICGGFVVT